MSDSPIFDQLASEYADNGKIYEEFSRFSTPAFRWSGISNVVQLDHQRPKTGVKFTKPIPLGAAVLSVQADAVEESGLVFDKTAKRLLEVPRVEDINDRPELIREHKQIQALTEDSGALMRDYIAMVGEEFAKTHPLAVVTDMSFEKKDDDTVSLVVEAVQPITPVKPLSERNTA